LPKLNDAIHNPTAGKTKKMEEPCVCHAGENGIQESVKEPGFPVALAIASFARNDQMHLIALRFSD
jgi:hypothetical protein